jgi:DnaJ homolog subfamily A member 2
LLGVDKKATTEEIRKAFRKKALKEHPDKGGDPDKFKEVTGAYEVLSNPEKRQLYDDYGEEGVKNGGAPGGGGMGGLFEMFTGGQRKQSGPRKGKAKLMEMEVTLEEIFNGAMKTIKISRDRICEPCEGKGGSNVTKCTKCKGVGVVTRLVQLGPGMYTQSQGKCPDCQGQGENMKEEDRCKVCKGKKVVKADRVLEVAIETGCPDEHDYIFTGENDEYVRVKLLSRASSRETSTCESRSSGTLCSSAEELTW